MRIPESADREGIGGNSAEFPVQAWPGNGAAGNTCGTVRSGLLRGRYPLTEFFRFRGKTAVGRGVSLPTFCICTHLKI